MKTLVGTSVGLITNLLNYIAFPLFFIYLGCNNYKKNINNGFIGLSESLKTGISIMLIAALIYATFNLIFNYIFPDFISEMLSITRQAMIEKKPAMTDEQIEMGISMTKKFMNPIIVFPVTIAMYAFFGLIYSLIIGAIIKKDNPQSL